MREDLTDNRLPVFPSATDDAYTVTQFRGGVSARATSYGNPITYTPEVRPANAIDGDPRTSWRTASASDVRGEELRLDFAAPVNTDHITVTQLLSGFRNRSITGLDLRFDGHDTVPVELGEPSNSAAGQVITFPQRSFSTLELIIRGDDSGRASEPGRPVRYNGLSEVGFSEVDVAGPPRRRARAPAHRPARRRRTVVVDAPAHIGARTAAHRPGRVGARRRGVVHRPHMDPADRPHVRARRRGPPVVARGRRDDRFVARRHRPDRDVDAPVARRSCRAGIVRDRR